MATLLELALPSRIIGRAADVQSEPNEPVTVLRARHSRRLPAPPVSALSRVRGGTFSSTVDVIRFADGSTAHTDLIRLNPNIDAYSLDFAGISPRQLSHYREVAWRQAPVRAAVLWQEEIGRILVNSFPHVTTAELTRRVRDAGFPLGAGAIREHEAIAATQAAIWRLTNGLELDTAALDEPVRATARIGDHPSARVVERDGGRLNWHSQLPAGETVFLELELVDQLQLEAFDFAIGPRNGRHELVVSLERSLDGAEWFPVSNSTVRLPAGRPGARRVRRRLGLGATVSSASAASGERGHSFYRLAATGPVDRDGLLDLVDVRLHLAGGSRFRNNARVVYLYDLLLAQATGAAPQIGRAAASNRADDLLGPFVLADAAATVTTAEARVVDTEGNHLWGPIRPGTRFFLHRHSGTAARLEVQLHHHDLQARLLVGSRTHEGPSVFTPLVSLATGAGDRVSTQTITLPAEPVGA